MSIMDTQAAKDAKANIWICGDGRWRVSVGGALGRMLPGSHATAREAEAKLADYLEEFAR